MIYESHWNRTAHRRLSYNRDKSERLGNTGVSLILSNFTSIQAKLNDCGGLQPHMGKEDGSIKLNNRESPGIALCKSIAQSRTIPGLIFFKMEVFKMFSSGCSVAFEVLMQETPYDHFDSGCEGICPECRSCKFHRPQWKYQSCVFAECPYSLTRLSTRRCQQDCAKER